MIQTLPASKKLHLLYVLLAQAMSALGELARERAEWEEDTHDCCSIGYMHKADLSEVYDAFDGYLETLSSIEDAAWGEQRGVAHSSGCSHCSLPARSARNLTNALLRDCMQDPRRNRQSFPRG